MPSDPSPESTGSGPIVAVDLGGTKLYVAEVDANGRTGRTVRRPTVLREGADSVVDEIREAVTQLAGGKLAYAGLAIGVAGQVDPASGTVLQAPNLRWKDFPLRERLESALGLGVTVINDVQAAAYGEWLHGAGRGVQDMVAVFVGTGVGGGIISRGELVIGCGGSAGEIGHTTIDMNGPECRCGNHGCLEAHAGGWAIARRAREAVERDPSHADALLAAAGGDASVLTAEMVGTTAAAGDPLARELVRQTGEALGVGIASLANAYNPCTIVLGGGVIEGMPELIDLVQHTVEQRALPAAVAQLSIVPAALGTDSGVVGAASWAFRRQQQAGAGDAGSGTQPV